MTFSCCTTCILALAAVSGASAQQTNKPALSPPPPAGVSVDTYIHHAWSTLERSMSSCTSLVDSKVKAAPILYLPRGFPEPAAVAAMRARCGVQVRELPVAVEEIGQPVQVPAPGLLYLPHPYVVPGGRFNEMYGWDSYFILLGLLHDHQQSLAQGIVENFFFEIENYGGVLNANRTYYFSRSQPPFLSSMIRAVYEAERAAGYRAAATAWLARAYPYAQRGYALWTRPEHRAGDTGLARYYDYAEGPVPEMGDDPTYYQNVIAWLLAHPGAAGNDLVDGPAEPTEADRARLTEISCDPEASLVCEHAHIGSHWLSQDYYKGDRAMRESGFDTTFRFGPFSGSTHHFAAVGLNALLYKYERDLAWMAGELGHATEARRWDAIADARRTAIDRYLWDPIRGMYFDYDFVAGKRSHYAFLTTFYPLWAGAASEEQARLVEANLSLFEKHGGLAASATDSGVQWDLPYGWAPLEWIAVDGMNQCADHADAERVAKEFLATIRDSFQRDHTIREKYNVVTGSSEFQVTAGYRQNVVGFGWTNGVYLEMESLVHQGEVPAHRQVSAKSGHGF
jgi:alpha,alpha-trehalase